ncbi:MAG: MFS transporter [Chloroflexi bacterium]|nr:MFS transporter [Chloroflexota bacterium]
MSSGYAKNQKVEHASSLVNRSPIFYGWIIMLVGTLGTVMTSPGQTDSVSIFIEHLIENLQISRSLVSTLYTAGTLVASFALPIVGQQIDRRGSRRMVVIISALFGLACIYMGLVQNALMLGLGFIAIRMMGQGSLSLVSRNVINQWWVRKRGMVMGISGMLTSLFGLGGFPNLINWLIPTLGWRLTYMLLGLLVMAVMIPIGLGFFRNRPEDYGLEPDGHEPDFGEEKATGGGLIEEDWTRSEAMRTAIFWVAGIGIASISMLTTGLFFHTVSIFRDNGLTSTIAASVYLPIALISASVNLISGVLVGRIPIRVLLAASLVLQAVALVIAAWFLQDIGTALLYGVVLGIMLGFVGTVGNVIWATYFGRRHLGSITGVTMTISVVGTALGPMPMGIARDLLGSYSTTLTVSAVLPLLLSVACLFCKQPQKRTESV